MSVRFAGVRYCCYEGRHLLDGIGQSFRCIFEMFVQSSIGFAPRDRASSFQLLFEVFADERMRINHLSFSR